MTKNMLTRDQQVEKYTKLADSALLASAHNAERSRFEIEVASKLTPGTPVYARVLFQAQRYATASKQAADDARLYLDRASQASAATESSMFEDL